MIFYYIVEDIFRSKEDLPAGMRILKISSLLFNGQFQMGDGPYETIKELRKNSIRFKKLLRDDPKRANKIIDKRFLISVVDRVFIPDETNEDLKNKLFHMIEHIVSGKVLKNDISGIHLFNPKIHRVLEITKEKNLLGIWEARVKAIRSYNNDWIEKNRPSTFFPIDWSNDLLVKKLDEAFTNKIKVADLKYIGQTNCGIQIVFIINDKKAVSVYPLYE